MSRTIDFHKVFAEYFQGCEALAYALSSRLAEGNICIDLESYSKELPGLLEEQRTKESFREEDSRFWVSPEEFDTQCQNPKFVAGSDADVKPFVIHNGKAYLHRYFRYETQVLEDIERLGGNLLIVTGGPGTGKTYSVSNRLVEMLNEKNDLKIALTAPTGKASARMTESIRKFVEKNDQQLSEKIMLKLTELKAQTIHRLLGYITNSVFFRYNDRNPLPYDVIIADECSMIDGALMAKLLNAAGNQTKVFLLGDRDQLASVEAGSVFGDLCYADHEKLQKETLTHSWRFSEDKGIGRLSREVIRGELTDLNGYHEDDQVSFGLLTRDTDKQNLFREKVLNSQSFIDYASKYEEYIKAEDIKEALGKLNLVRFLCVTRENDFSVNETNKAIEQLLRRRINDRTIFHPVEGFYHNQPIIITKNDYKLKLFNGDVGIIRRKHTPSGQVLVAYFEIFEDGETTLKEIPAGYLNHYETVFAMTIHKSQGSEFENVVVILPEKQGEKLLTRELLYTGITRAMHKVHVIATEDVLLKCVSRGVSRASGLKERLSTEN